MIFKVACASSIGMRPNHEDNYLINTSFMDSDIQQKMPEIRDVHYQFKCSRKVNIIAVSDGMGGHKAGEVASRFCVQRL